MLTTNHYRILVGLGVLFSLGMAVGYRIAPTKIVEVEKKVDTHTSEGERETHEKTVTKEVEHPDGTKEKTTETTKDSSTSTKKESNSVAESSKETTRDSGITISALAAVDINDFTKIHYGAHVTKPLIGPISVGVFGLTSGHIGASVGLSF